MAVARKGRVSTRVRVTSSRQGPRPPMALVERMQSHMINLVNAFIDRLMRSIEPELRARFDAVDDPFPIDDVHGMVSLGDQFLRTTFRAVDRQAAEDLSRVVPIPATAVLKNTGRLEQSWVKTNTELIKLESRSREEIRKVIAGPLREGVRVEEVRAKIEARLGVVRSRAELIARDQTLKLYGQIQQQRQTAAGITQYTWSTSDDERVRPDHQDLDGTTQSWDDPPIVDKRTGRRAHPGLDFQCRCSAVPILQEDDVEVDQPPEPAPADVTPGVDLEAQFEAQRAAEAEAERVAALHAEAERKAAARLEAQRVAAEAEAERLRVAAQQREAERRQQLQAETRRLQAEARRARTAAQTSEAAPHAPLRVKTFGVDATEAAKLEQHYTRRIAALAPDASTPRLRELELHAVENFKLNIAGTEITAGAYYDPNANKLVMPTRAPTNLDKRGLHQKLWSIPNAAATQEDAALRTFTHEYGHHIHNTAADVGAVDFDARLRAAYAKLAPNAAASLAADPARRIVKSMATEGAVSAYGTQDHHEFWAEAFAAYHHEKSWLFQNKPDVFQLVENLLQYLRNAPR